MPTPLTRYIECYIPTTTCNLQCHYCYIAQKNLFSNKIAKISHSLDEIRHAFSKERLGGACLINFCAGGETLLSPDILPIVRTLLECGHYVMVVTNGTLTKRFDEVLSFPLELRKQLMFKFSFHYLEFKRLGILEQFAANVNRMRQAKCSITVEITPSDELIPYIDEVRQFSIDNFGAPCHVTIARDDRTNDIHHLSSLSFDEYQKTWGVFDSELFSFKSQIFYHKRREFCYAGSWSFWTNLETGETHQCYFGKSLGNLYDFSSPLHFEPVGYCCVYPHCYNGHAFLTLGDIPDLSAPTYAQVRDRVCSDGSTWLQPEVRAFLSQKLYNNNPPCSSSIKIKNKISSIIKKPF